MPVSIDLESTTVSRIALLGSDYHGVNFDLLVDEGDAVAAGAALMRDARRPEIRFTAPLAGRVARIERGKRRRLISLQISVDADAAADQTEAVSEPPAVRDRDSLRGYLLATGAWAGLRVRPFGGLPDPDAEPAAIFVNTLEAAPDAPTPQPVIEAWRAEFDSAVEALARISAAPVYVCHARDHDFARLQQDNVQCVGFGEDSRAALAGTHIHRLCPIGFGGGQVWQLGYQDAIAIGHWLCHGRPWAQRVIALCGSAIKNPRSLLVPPGAALGELLDGETTEVPLRVDAASTPGARCGEVRGFLAAAQRRLSVSDDSDALAQAERNAPRGVIIPNESIEAVAPPGIYPIPLMRALQLGDAERARELGALELLEEDVLPLNRACVSNNDYPALLRGVLDQLEGARG